MKTPFFTLLSFLFACHSLSAANLMINLRTNSSNSAASGDVASPYLTLSPAHAAGTVANSETVWNSFSSTAASSSLLYSDGTSASGVTLTFGAETSAGAGTIDLGSVSSINISSVYGTGGSTAGQLSLVGNAGSIYGSGNNSSNSAVGRAGWIGGGTAGSGIALGMRVDGLAAGEYRVYVMARNTNTNATTATPMNLYATAGAFATSFTFSALTAEIQANTTFPSSNATAYNTFEDGVNYVALNITLADGDSLFLAADGGTAAESRGFLNMVQIVAIPEPASALLGTLGLLALLRRRRACV
jgi:hypothetical protein